MADLSERKPFNRGFEPKHERRFDGFQSMLIEDDPHTLQLLGDYWLKPLGFSVRPYSSFSSALRDIRQAEVDFDIIFTDFTLPDMKAEDFMEGVRSAGCYAPIVVVSGSSLLPARKDSIRQQIGNVQFLMKPFDKEGFLDRLTVALPSLPNRS